MKLSPLAMIRFGELYRRGGEWRGRRVLGADWIEASWRPYGASPETGHGYGYGWYIWHPAGEEVFYARGFGGQMIYVVPRRALTVAITSDPTRPSPIDGHLGVLNRIFVEDILPEAPVEP